MGPQLYPLIGLMSGQSRFALLENYSPVEDKDVHNWPKQVTMKGSDGMFQNAIYAQSWWNILFSSAFLLLWKWIFTVGKLTNAGKYKILQISIPTMPTSWENYY